MRTERPSQVVESLTVLSRRAVAPSNALADPSTHDFTGWPPIGSPASVVRPFPSKQALSSMPRLRRSHHGPYIDLLQSVC